MNQWPPENRSIWRETVKPALYPTLTDHLEVDVCIVGGGIGGLTTAYLLAQAGKKVAILERFDLGSGQTGKTAGHVTTVLDRRYFALEKQLGHQKTLLAAQSHQQALNQIEEIVRVEKIRCEMERVNGYLFNSEEQAMDLLFKELDATHQLGFSDVHILAEAPLSSFDTGLCLKFPRQIQLHPLKYLSGLADLVIKKGGLIFCRTPVCEVQGGDSAFAKTEAGWTVQAQAIVVATNTPFNDLFAIHTKQFAYRSYLIGLRIPPGSVARGLYWDTQDPYHYIRVAAHPPFSETLLVGGEDHRTGQNPQPEECFRRLESWTRDRFPFAQEIDYQWSGQILEPLDGLAYLGHNPLDRKNIYILTGASGNGLTHCTIGAMLIRDQILQIANPWEELYEPSRIPLGELAQLFKKNMNVASQYGDWLTGNELESIEKIPKGVGATVRHGLEKIAVYKDDQGNLELYSAACPHLGGVVQWNSSEKSWDCPCHGSRFDCHGKVIDGPAFQDLKPIEALAPANPDEVETTVSTTGLFFQSTVS